ncbi:MAG TPA: GreA/GreB family elongation factor [Bacillales bacterium]|nr:GreA/GreB family elongation factor [Bacillales bacterium]
MKENAYAFTPEGIKNVTAELEQLRLEKKNHATKVSEGEGEFLSERIGLLESLLNHAEPVNAASAEGIVKIGATVVLRDAEFQDETEFMLVNRFEADPVACKLSDESPLGRKLLGKKRGERITVETPEGPIVYEVLNVEYRNG